MDPFLILGVDRRASPAEIERAFRRRAKLLHPDKHPDALLQQEASRMFVELQLARDEASRISRRESHTTDQEDQRAPPPPPDDPSPPSDVPSPPPYVPSASPRRRLSGAHRLALSCVVVALVAGGIFTWKSSTQRTDSINQVGAVSRSAVTILTEWDATDIDGVAAQLHRMATGSFKDEVFEFFHEDHSDLVDSGAASTSVILDVRVQSVEGAVATSIVDLTQTIRTSNPPDVVVQDLSSVVTLVEVDGEWLVSNVVISD